MMNSILVIACSRTVHTIAIGGAPARPAGQHSIGDSACSYARDTTIA